MPPSVKREPVDDQVPHPPNQAAPHPTNQTHNDDDASDDGDFGRDIKPKIDGLETIGVNFNPLRPVPKAGPRKPNEITIKLLGSKDGRHYKVKLRRLPGDTGLKIKQHLVKYYGYEMGILRLIYDGKIVQDHQTMAELEVEHYDEFDVFLERPCETLSWALTLQSLAVDA